MTDPPIYRELAERHDIHIPDGTPALDAQSLAYRGMGPGDIVGDDELPGMAERIHPPYLPGAAPAPATVEEFEAAQWDADRLDPRPT